MKPFALTVSTNPSVEPPLIQNNRFVNREVPVSGVLDRGFLKKLSVLKELSSSKNNPPRSLPRQILHQTDFSDPPDDSLTIRWMGHSFLLIEWEGFRFLTDPVFGNAAPVPEIIPRYQGAPVRRKELPAIDFVLLSHDHYDHLEKSTIRFLRKKDCFFIVPEGVEKHLLQWGVKNSRICVMRWGNSLKIGNLTIHMTESRHFSGRTLADKNKTLWASFVISNGKRSVFFGGDGGYGKHFREIGKIFGPFDLAFLEIDAWNERWPSIHMTPEDVIHATWDLNTGKCFPIHWGVFNLADHRWNESIERLRVLAEQAGIQILTPVMGEKIDPEKNQTGSWWLQL